MKVKRCNQTYNRKNAEIPLFYWIFAFEKRNIKRVRIFNNKKLNWKIVRFSFYS